MNHCMGSSHIYKDCEDSLNGVDLSMNQRTWSTPIYNSCGYSLKGVDPSMNPRKEVAPIHVACDFSLRGVDPPMNHRRGGGYSHLQGLRSFIEESRTLNQSLQAFYFYLQQVW